MQSVQGKIRQASETYREGELVVFSVLSIILLFEKKVVFHFSFICKFERLYSSHFFQ